MGKADSETYLSNAVRNIELALATLNQLCIGFVTIYVSWACLRTGLTGITLHAWLVTFGYCFLMAEGMLCHYDGNGLTLALSRKGKTLLHIALQILGGGMGVAGCLVQLINDDWLISVTVHSRLGFAAFILSLVSLLTGLCAFLSKNMARLLSPLVNKSFHVVLAVGTFVTSMMAQYYGYTQTGIFSKNGKDFLSLIQIVTLVLMVLTCIGPFKSLYHKIGNLFG